MFFQLLTRFSQNRGHTVKTPHTVSETEVCTDRTVSHFSLLSFKMHEGIVPPEMKIQSLSPRPHAD